MLIKDTTGRYIAIKADAKFHETVSKDTDGAVFREYEDSDGNKGSKWELVYRKVDVFITDVKFEDGKFGENVLLTLKDGEEVVTLAEGVSTGFGEDLLKKLPSIDFAKRATLSPYSFENDKGKIVKGVTVYQGDAKVMNFFYDFEKKAALHDFPTPEGDTTGYDQDDWKVHFIKVRKFLVKYAKEHVVPMFPLEITAEQVEEAFDTKVEMASVADMDFEAKGEPVVE